MTEQTTVKHVVKVCMLLPILFASLVPFCSAFTETLMEKNTEEKKKIILTATVTSMQAVYDKCFDCWTVLLFSNNKSESHGV